MATGIQKVFSNEGNKLLRQLVEEKVSFGITRKQLAAIRQEIENYGELKKHIVGWRIRPWIVENGQKFQICETYQKFEDAKKRLRDIENQVEKRIFTRPSKVPTMNEACDSYLENKKKTAMKDGGKRSAPTISFYQNIIANHIKPILGSYRLNDIDKKIAESSRDKWCETAPIFVKQVLMVSRAIYEENSEAVPKNPFKQIGNVPRTDGRKTEELSEVDPENVYSSRAEIDILLANAITQRDRLVLWIAAEVGLRDGEVLGLAQEFVLPEKELIKVRYQWRCLKEDYKDGVAVLQKPKTPQSIRDIKISTALAAELAKWKRENAKNTYVSTFDNKRVQLMFMSKVNGPCSRHTLKKAMDRAVANAHEHGSKLKKLDFYSLRHFCASFLIQNGLRRGLISDLEIAGRMGHKDSTVTRRVYARFLHSESTFNPNDLWSKPVPVEQQPTAEQPEMLQ
jgi:integrase